MEHAFEKKFPVNAKDYKLYEEVGEGVSATVFRALCVPLNEIVAIKVLDLEKCSNDLDGVRREVQTMSLIDHSNVLRAHCSFTTAHNLWVVMPYMAGGSCLHIMKSAYPEGFEEFIIAILLREVLKALAYLHSHGHIHRDVKAGNILLDCDGAVKLGDFGVSACMFDTGDRQRSRNTFVGTPCWMAPEVMQQLHGYDFKADIWSFGITALELAHGHAPFSKYPPMKVLLMTLQNAPPGLDYERDKRFSKSFKEMVAACLVKDPKKRPASEKLLKHHFFKHARSHEFLSHTILDGLPPLGDRFRMLKVKEADLLIQNKALYGDKEQLSQQEYIRGISAWNFNTEDLKNQAALIQEPDGIIISNFDGAEIQVEENNNNNSLLSFPSPPLQALKGCFDVVEDDVVTTGTTPSAHHRVRADVPEKLMNGSDGSSARAVPRHVIPSPKKFFSGTFVPDNHPSPRKASIEGEQRSFSGPLASRQWRDSNNTNTPGTGVAEETSPDRGKVQRRGRFKVTSSDVVAPKVQANSHAPLLPDSLLPALQGLLQQNAFQREELLRLIKQVEQNSGVPDVSAADLSSSRERELHSQLIHLQRSIGTLLEEVQQQKTHNSLLEQRLNTLSKDNGR